MKQVKLGWLLGFTMEFEAKVAESRFNRERDWEREYLLEAVVASFRWSAWVSRDQLWDVLGEVPDDVSESEAWEGREVQVLIEPRLAA